MVHAYVPNINIGNSKFNTELQSDRHSVCFQCSLHSLFWWWWLLLLFSFHVLYLHLTSIFIGENNKHTIKSSFPLSAWKSSTLRNVHWQIESFEYFQNKHRKKTLFFHHKIAQLQFFDNFFMFKHCLYEILIRISGQFIGNWPIFSEKYRKEWWWRALRFFRFSFDCFNKFCIRSSFRLYSTHYMSF